MLAEFYRANESLIKKLLAITGFVVFVYVFINYVLKYVAPFVLGYIFSLIAEPLVGFCSKKLKMKRWLCSLLAVALLVAAMVVLGVTIVARIAREVRSLDENLPEYIARYNDVTDGLAKLTNNFWELIPEEFRESIAGGTQSVIDSLKAVLGAIAADFSLNFVSKLPVTLVNFVLTLVSGFFFIKDKHVIAGSLAAAAPEWLNQRMSFIRKGFVSAFWGYVKAELIVASVISSICVLGLTILRSPYTLLFGLIIAVLDFLPVVGSGLVLLPWVLWSLAVRDYYMAAGLAAIYGATILTRQVLEPKVLSTQTGIHPLLMLISVYAGLRLLGPIGILAGPVTMVMAKIILEANPAGGDNELRVTNDE